MSEQRTNLPWHFAVDKLRSANASQDNVLNAVRNEMPSERWWRSCFFEKVSASTPINALIAEDTLTRKPLHRPICQMLDAGDSVAELIRYAMERGPDLPHGRISPWRHEKIGRAHV